MTRALLLLLAVILGHSGARGEILVGLTNQVWRYDQSDTDRADSGWQNPDYDDSTWPEGRGIFARETSQGTAALVYNVYPYTNTVLEIGRPTHYFRTQFTFAGDPSQTLLVSSNQIDDGFVMYLNGVEVLRYNLPPGPVTHNTLAGTALTGEGVYVVRDLAPGALLNGENVLAVEVHQTSVTSADVVWGTVLHAHPTRAPVFVYPTNGITNVVVQTRSTNLWVIVDAAPAGDLQWFKDGEPIPGATQSSYVIPAMSASDEGVYWCTASNSLGGAVSPTITVLYEPDPVEPRLVRATADSLDLTQVTLTFSEDVINADDFFIYYLEATDDPGSPVIVMDASYSFRSNIVVLTLEQPLDRQKTYDLYVFSHSVQDHAGNYLSDPATIRVMFPTVFQEGRDGYVGTQDTDLRQALPSNSFGTNISVFCDASPLTHGLLRFDDIIGTGPDPIQPYIAIIHSAKLRLYTVDRSAANTPVRLTRMLAPWNEAQSTWNSMANGIDETNGVETGTTDALVVADLSNAFVEIDVTAAVQAWADGASNYGWAFLPTGTDGWGWASSEYFDVLRRPALLVHHSHFDPICRIMQQPQPVTVRAGQPFYLEVLSMGSDLTYEWFRNGELIVGATASTYSVNRARLSDNGAYHVIVRRAGLPEPEFACTSSVAQVTVFCDDYPVQLWSAIGNVDQTTITLAFSHLLEPALAQNVSNYALSDGLVIAGVHQSGNRITLTNSPERQVGRNYTLTVRNLREDTDCANMLHPNPTILGLTQDVRLLSFDAVWKYHNDGADLGTTWKHPRYDDASWPQGPGLLGFETQPGTLAALSNQDLFIGTQLTRTAPSGQQIMTDYFRTLVNVPFYAEGFTFQFRHVVDDGAIFYLNGNEVARFNMPTGPIVHTTKAITAPLEGVIRSIANLTGLSCGLQQPGRRGASTSRNQQ